MLGLSAALLPALAWADPVSLFGAAAFFANAAGLTVAATALTYIAIAAAVYGAVTARRDARRKAAQARAEYNASLEDRNVTVLQAAPDWRIVYGRPFGVGGDIVAIFTSDKTGTRSDGTTYTKADALKHLVIVWAAHECQAVNDLQVDGVPLGTLDGSGWVTGGEFYATVTVHREITIAAAGSSTQPYAVTVLNSVKASPADSTTPEAASYTVTGGGLTINNTSGFDAVVTFTMAVPTPTVRASHHLGTAAQTVDTYLNGVVPSQWTSDHRLRGLTYSVVTLDLENPRFQGGPPNITADISGRKVLDTRTSTTAYSENPALIVRDFLTAPWGYECAAGDIDTTACNTAANACDSLISLTVGAVTETNQPTFTCNGVTTAGQSREAVLEQMLQSMAGTATYDAKWRIFAGAWTAPVMALTDDDLVGQLEIVQADAALDETFNGVRGTHIPRGKAVPVEFDSYQNATFVTADGAELWHDMDLPWTDHKARARNLCRIFIERARNALVVRYPAKLRAWPLQVGDRVTVTSAEYGFSTKNFRVTDWQFGSRSPVVLTLQEDEAAAYDLADAASADPAPNTNLPNPWAVAALSGVAAASGTTHAARLPDGSYQTRVQVSWTAVADPYVTDGSGRIRVRWRRVARDPANVWQTADVPGNETKLYIGGVSGFDVLLIEVQAINGLGARGDAVYLSHTVTGVSGTPGGGNLLSNSSFEVDSNADGLADGWTTGVNGGCSVSAKSLDPNGRAHGLKSQRFDFSGATGSGDNLYIWQDAPARAAQGGSKGALRGHFVSDLNPGKVLYLVEFYDATPALISSAGSGWFTLTGGLDKPEFLFDVPAGTVTIRLFVIAGNVGNSSASRVYMDALKLELASAPTAYSTREDEILAGAVGTTEIAAEAATTLVQASSTSGASTGGGGGTVSQARATVTWTNTLGYTVPVQVECSVLVGGFSWNTSTPSVGRVSYRYSSTSLGTVVRQMFDCVALIPAGGNYGPLAGLEHVALPAGETLTFELLWELTHTTTAAMNPTQSFCRIAAIKR